MNWGKADALPVLFGSLTLFLPYLTDLLDRNRFLFRKDDLLAANLVILKRSKRISARGAGKRHFAEINTSVYLVKIHSDKRKALAELTCQISHQLEIFGLFNIDSVKPVDNKRQFVPLKIIRVSAVIGISADVDPDILNFSETTLTIPPQIVLPYNGSIIHGTVAEQPAVHSLLIPTRPYYFPTFSFFFNIPSVFPDSKRNPIFNRKSLLSIAASLEKNAIPFALSASS